MHRSKTLAASCLILTTAVTTSCLPTSSAIDKPVLTSIVALVSFGFTVAVLSSYIRRRDRAGASGRQWRAASGSKYDAVPLLDVDAARPPHDQSQHIHEAPHEGYPSSLKKIRILFLVLVAALCLRVETFRRIVDNVQCAEKSWEPIIPFVFSLLNYWRVRKHARPQASGDYHGIYRFVVQRMQDAPFGFVVATFIVSITSMIALSAATNAPSTYICAASLPSRSAVPALQHAGTALDILVVYCVTQLLTLEEGRGPRTTALRFMTIAYSFLFSAAILASACAIWYFADPDRRHLMLELPFSYWWSIIKLEFPICLGVAAGLLCIFHFGPTTTALLATFTATVASTTISPWQYRQSFPPSSPGYGLIAICVAAMAFFSHLKLHEFVTDGYHTGKAQLQSRRVPTWGYLAFVLFGTFRFTLWYNHTTEVNFHPIDLLVWEAQERHSIFLKQASSSSGLRGAQDEYWRRYENLPPPHFDKWYQYATARNSVIIDDYDGIHQDLLPFHALSAAEIRENTWALVKNPWNDAAGITIRAGRAAPMPNVMPTHMWMLEGVVAMINNFAEWLPDMDLAFNLNDESRITIPYSKIEAMRKTSLSFGKFNAWSVDRESGWKPVTEEASSDTPLVEKSWQRTFYDFGSVSCPPTSTARTNRLWSNGRLCIDCALPQSLGGFLSNWSKAADICHQPDLADLHGLYTAPAAFKASHELLPVFSQSKAYGFADIRYPSPWNYLDKAKYAPTYQYPDSSFGEKMATIFWRGATSEGVSVRGQWRGMTRQRFVHMANNPNNSAPAQTLLIPLPETLANATGRKYRYEYVPSSHLTSLLSADVKFVGPIARCGGSDCDNQATEFKPLAAAQDFQSLWQYKYLLDMDGAGFSGRFLPFLQSNCLPFKAALFREWWDDRVTAWQHFVPLDLRGHGFWATLAYFAGFEGDVGGGKVVSMAPHEEQAEQIASAGRDWAEKALRKEDMEIYMFRLLLEWARLTDDRRDMLGFDVDNL